ncbi:lysophospholipid acyltransferase family protein [Aliivibrio fischeri]|uniref:lysophospholipid acyltransferase family protein n=1 Tax=Aliivibrio fischeri TaxID=668 RepID=UPI0007C5A5A4|nr:lysophospholipid acyltransferase family protein [Aliivibrio fischeri]MBP3141397.1 1-acyl-sn-glycerol-3-phosphate acyltransferase [Aliivibrio fischeri]MBP3155306.1 1-acyl-sn-glycerol-3-phosphate acyltransferase [Aliivibrio fischeri]MCE7572381.1 1-acyl-sn-glycerol-3-phosphate acyltransferase [Aliivibrio fischeri]
MTLLQRTDKYWRILATGFCFSLFGVGALCLTFIVFPLLTFTAKDKKQREVRVQSIIQRSFFIFCKTMHYSRAIKYQFDGAELLQSDRNCLIVANHPSLIDYVLIASQLKQCDCIVKAALWHNPFTQGIVRAAGYIPNQEPEAFLEECSEKLNSGNVLLVFPEGTRTTPGKKSKLQRGAAQIAVRSQSDIRIIHITVTPSFLTKEAKWYQVPDVRPFFHLQVKERVAINPFIEDADASSSAARNVNRFLDTALYPQNEVNTSKENK